MAEEYSREKIAKLINDQAKYLQDMAQDKGATAYLRRPVVREKPNERFLINTIKNVQSANRRTEEELMWQAREGELRKPSNRSRDERSPSRPVPPRLYPGESSKRASQDSAPLWRSGKEDGSRKRRRGDDLKAVEQLERRDASLDQLIKQSELRMGQEGGDRFSSPSGSPVLKAAGRTNYNLQLDQASQNPGVRGDGEEADGEGLGLSDVQMSQLLSKKKVRGRGAVGSRMDEPGPFLQTARGAGEEAAHHPLSGFLQEQPPKAAVKGPTLPAGYQRTQCGQSSSETDDDDQPKNRGARPPYQITGSQQMPSSGADLGFKYEKQKEKKSKKKKKKKEKKGKEKKKKDKR